MAQLSRFSAPNFRILTMATIVGDMGEDLDHGPHREDDLDEEPHADTIELDLIVPEASQNAGYDDNNEIQEVCSMNVTLSVQGTYDCQVPYNAIV